MQHSPARSFQIGPAQPRADDPVGAGIAALRAGDAGQAKRLLQAAAERGLAVPWLALARACNQLGDMAGEEAALQHQLEAERRNLPALLAMGELRARQRDDRSATAFFRTAVETAAVTPGSAQFAPQLNRAQIFLRDSAVRFEDHLHRRLDEAGLDERALSPRLRKALDLLLGRTPLYLQQPNMFYFPGLPQRAFYEREEFDWLAAIEAETTVIRAEVEQVMREDAAFGPFVVQTADMPPPANPLLNDPSWGVFHLWQRGRKIEENAARVPRTIAALDGAPIPQIAGSAPMVLFSLLRPGTHIVPHHGIMNTRLICHIPLIAPEGCALRVGSETRCWEQGKALIFDDSIEHEAWNRSPSNRIVLLFEIWRPEIGAEERAELSALFEAIELFPAGDG